MQKDTSPQMYENIEELKSTLQDLLLAYEHERQRIENGATKVTVSGATSIFRARQLIEKLDK